MRHRDGERAAIARYARGGRLDGGGGSRGDRPRAGRLLGPARRRLRVAPASSTPASDGRRRSTAETPGGSDSDPTGRRFDGRATRGSDSPVGSIQSDPPVNPVCPKAAGRERRPGRPAHPPARPAHRVGPGSRQGPIHFFRVKQFSRVQPLARRTATSPSHCRTARRARRVRLGARANGRFRPVDARAAAVARAGIRSFSWRAKSCSFAPSQRQRATFGRAPGDGVAEKSPRGVKTSRSSNSASGRPRARSAIRPHRT